MKARTAIFTAPHAIELEEEALPEQAPGQILIQSRYSAISPGSELRVYRGQIPEGWPADATLSALSSPLEYPLKYGYTTVGTVVKAGPDTEPGWVGQRVFAFHPHASHFWIKPHEVVPIPSDLSWLDALFVSNMESAVNFVMDGRPLIGEQVVVFGQGIVGLLTTALLTQFPLAGLATLDLYELRRSFSLEAGAHKAFDPAAPTAQAELRQHLTPTAAADLLFELSGDPAALNMAIATAGFDGRIVVGSWYGSQSAPLALGRRFHRQRIRLISSQVSTLAPVLSGRWDKGRRMQTVWQMIRRIRPTRFITHRLPIEQIARAFALLDQQPQNAVQVVLVYD